LKKLEDRVYGFHFSGTEYEIIFKSDDMGFVRYDGRSKKVFYLTPHPVVDKPKDSVTYVLEGCPAPDPKKLIRILSKESVKELVAPAEKKSLIYGERVTTYVHSWEEVNPNKVFRRRDLLYEDYVYFFNAGFVASVPDAMIEPVAHAMAIYSASSPIVGANDKGGINAAIRYGKKTPLWTQFNSMLDVIPNELKQTRSPFFYKYGQKEQIISPLASSEVNLAYPDPRELLAQIPISLIRMDANRTDSYKEYATDIMPHVRAYELDILLFTPALSRQAEKWLQEAIYELKSNIENTEYMVYNQDIGMAVPKIAASIARLHFDDSITKDHIDEAFDTWADAYFDSIYWDTRVASGDDLIKVRKLGTNAKKLYFHLLEHYSVGEDIPKTALRTNVPLHDFDLENAIESLLQNGAIFYSNLNNFKILEINKNLWER
jgi:hypothetical protein